MEMKVRNFATKIKNSYVHQINNECLWLDQHNFFWPAIIVGSTRGTFRQH